MLEILQNHWRRAWKWTGEALQVTTSESCNRLLNTSLQCRYLCVVQTSLSMWNTQCYSMKVTVNLRSIRAHKLRVDITINGCKLSSYDLRAADKNIIFFSHSHTLKNTSDFGWSISHNYAKTQYKFTAVVQCLPVLPLQLHSAFSAARVWQRNLLTTLSPTTPADSLMCTLVSQLVQISWIWNCKL